MPEKVSPHQPPAVVALFALQAGVSGRQGNECTIRTTRTDLCIQLTIPEVVDGTARTPHDEGTCSKEKCVPDQRRRGEVKRVRCQGQGPGTREKEQHCPRWLVQSCKRRIG